MRCYSCSAFPGASGAGARCPGTGYQDMEEGVSCTVRALSDSTVVFQVDLNRPSCSLDTYFVFKGNVPKATGCTDEMIQHYNYLSDKTFRLGNSK